MIFSLAALREAPRAFERGIPLGDLRDEEGLPLLLGTVSVRGRFEPTGVAVDLEAHLTARLGLRCSRCLARFEQELGLDLQLEIVGAASEFGGPEARIGSGDAELWYAEGDAVDLAAIVREQIHLNLPLKPVCAPGCRGLCASCGADRNSIECGCRAGEPDPRLAPLRGIFERDRSHEGS